MTDRPTIRPDRMVSVRETFGIDSPLRVPAFSLRDDHVPEVDTAYRFNADVTLALLAGFERNRRVIYLPRDEEVAIVQARVPHLADAAGRRLVESMVALADLTRKGFAAGDLSTLMSPRTVITWAENLEIFRDPARAFELSFVNKCDEAERPVVAEYYQRCFDGELAQSYRHAPEGVG